MDKSILIEFNSRPSAISFMLNALRTSQGRRQALRVPPITARWRNLRVDRNQLDDFLRLTGLCADAALPMIYPHVFGFRLQMVVLSHPTFPIPIWSALQIRNEFVQHCPISADACMKLETHVADQRVLQNGYEVDLHTVVRVAGRRVWDSLNTFYYRGRFGEPESPSPHSPAPEKPTTTIAQWHLASGVGWRVARMTGDYNGIHRWNWYARLFGFKSAFFHPQIVAGQCMARLVSPEVDLPQRLALWLKGPVYFDADVTLLARSIGEVTEFALLVAGEERPAILGRWGGSSSKSQPEGSIGLRRSDTNRAE